MNEEEIIIVKETPIKLGQFLKLANIAQDGIEAKILIQQGGVFVNNEEDLRRGRKLYENDIVMYNNVYFRVAVAT